MEATPGNSLHRFSSVSESTSMHCVSKKEQLLASDCRALAAAQQDRPSLEAFLPAMTIPCLLYAGEADAVFPKAQKSATLLPKCTFVSFPGLDHFAAFYNAKIILPHVLNFLRNAEG
jgi:pimeloyl-ACP methyl ester carboxylesterase